MTWAVDLALLLLCVAMGLSAYRMVKGPTAPDRVVALDGAATDAVALFLTLSIKLDTSLFFDAVLVVALLGFVGTVALAQCLGRGDLFD